MLGIAQGLAFALHLQATASACGARLAGLGMLRQRPIGADRGRFPLQLGSPAAAGSDAAELPDSLRSSAARSAEDTAGPKPS